MFVSFNLVIRFLLELFLLGSLGVWGYHLGGGTFARFILTGGLPLAAAIIWGLFISPKARFSLPTPLVVFIEFLLVGAAAYGLIWSGYFITSVIYVVAHIGNRLLLGIFLHKRKEE
ncbi:YrdB family protein [Paenibacillus chondroitinus]|uniref:YrdB family protein n=1 Tax=Paenibacillus chondroitinus TaxID=59842 RepID=A0ABU6DQV6_9BACL|nr:MULTISPECIES: YrdB family protein [Paenibacillus]MCY9663121.1 YrdB family protein [Paenibacillus anseongense]MEB4799206.1 YrdB family protein [Paenibacillus chondroitinus]